MQSDTGKLFIGGISWDTTEERLKEYFGSYGEILEVVIMKDRSTGRARGFGFVVFTDPAVSERVIKEKHNIDGRLVEAKKAIPRDDNTSVISRSSSSIQGSPGPKRTKKIFVGGLATTVTETDFKSYFENFGTITDVVVMYDHNTQRPRGFGFITYDSEDAVDRVLFKTFHELNGKMVEVKRAVPKELSPSSSRSSLSGYNNYGVNMINDLLNGYNQGDYSPNSLGGYGLRVDGRFSPIIGARNVFGPPGSNYQMGLNMRFEPRLNPNFGSSPNLGENPYFVGNPNRAENFRGDASFFSSGTNNLWGNERQDHGINSNSSAYIGSSNWGSIPISPQRGAGNVSTLMGNLNYGGGDSTYNLGVGGGGSYARNINPIGPQSSSYAQSNGGYGATWRSANSAIEGSGSFGYGIGSGVSDAPAESSPRFIGGYNVSRDR